MSQEAAAATSLAGSRPAGWTGTSAAAEVEGRCQREITEPLPTQRPIIWARNQVLRLGEEEGELRRLLAVDGIHWAWIPLPVGTSSPEWIPQSELNRLFRKGALTLIASDPFSPPRAPSPKSRREGVRRWKILRPLLGSSDLSLLVPEKQHVLLQEVSTESGESIRTLRTWVRRFWELGQVPNAFIPSYEKRGGPGKPKDPYGKKRGARPLDTPEGGPVPGINVDEAVRKKIERGARTYRNKQRMTWRKAWLRTLHDEFGRSAPSKDELRRGPDLLPGYPSLHQFKYWGQKALPVRDKGNVKDREGHSRYHALHRSALKSAKPQDLGPGARTEFDSTQDDVYLVSRLDRAQVVGRPWIFLLVDAFSTMVTGVYARFRHPSWEAGRMTILSSLADKVEFCGRYGIQIEPEDWPTHHLSSLYLADRGELISKKSDQLLRELFVRIANAPRRRGDRKPHVERRFRTVQDNVTHWVPGRNHNLKNREGEDYRYDSILTLDDYIHLVLLDVLERNNHHPIVDRRSIPADYPVPLLGHPTPLQLFIWGLENRSGFLTTADPERTRFALLPTERTRVDKQRGIRFNHAYYVPEDEGNESWFLRNLRDGPITVERKWDESDQSAIWIRPEPAAEWSRFVPSLSGDRWVAGLSKDEVEDAWVRGRRNTKRVEREATGAHVAFVGLAKQRTDDAQAQRDARLQERGQVRVTISGQGAAKAREPGRTETNTGVGANGGVATVEANATSPNTPQSRRRQRDLEIQRRLDREAERRKELE